MTAMTMHAGRARFQGVHQILRFNWPMYVASAIAISAGALVVVAARPAPLVTALVVAGLSLALWWSVASLLASHWVYDRAALFDLNWLRPIVRHPKRWTSVHAGLDEFTPSLRRDFGEPVAILHIYDPATMTEPSISRAQSLSPIDPATRRAAHDHLPLPDSAVDSAFVFFAAHELRSPVDRTALFAELRRALAPDGVIVVLEHLRDPWGFAAFGPGFLHFHSRAAWLSSFTAANLRLDTEQSITPFARVFVLRGSA